jgi:hypothetical protein
MTFSDYLIDITLISIVLVQMRGRKLTARALMLPVAIVAYVAITYLKAIPTNGNNLFLIIGCAAVGATLGGLAARFTTVHANADGIPIAKAGLVAAALWILGTGCRLAFQLYASHGGAASIEHWSVAHSISAATAWSAALILMAISEATVRTGVLAWRGYRVQQSVRSEQNPPNQVGQDVQYGQQIQELDTTVAVSPAALPSSFASASVPEGHSVVFSAGRS